MGPLARAHVGGTLAFVCVICVLTTAALAQTPGAPPDFNGDGFADLAVGVPFENLELDTGEIKDAGAVAVIYGAAGGLSAAGNQLWHQDRAGVHDVAERNDRFGSLLAAGDFDGDGFSDLAVGVDGEDVGDVKDAGAVQVLYGTASGLLSGRDQIWDQGSLASLEDPEEGDGFGLALATGDFDADGFADLAIGAPLEGLGGASLAGVVHVLYGGPSGLAFDRNQLWSQDVTGVDGEAGTNDLFGNALAAGDINGDGYADLAIGVTGETINGQERAGAVEVLYGGAAGLAQAGGQLWHQDRAGIRDSAEPFDNYGRSLAIADFDADGFDDLAVGIEFEDVDDQENAGSVNVLYGGPDGLSPTGNQLWVEGAGGLPGDREAENQFGKGLAAGDFDADGFADLAVGADGETVAGAKGAGGLIVLRGGVTGLSAESSRLWTQSSGGVREEAEAADDFGAALSAADFDGDGFADLAVGAHRETLNIFFGGEGAVNVLYGSAGGLTGKRDQLWSQGRFGLLDEPEFSDGFGFSLTGACRFDFSE